VADLAGQTLRGYEIRQKVGAGGYGAVYKAYQSAVDREAAIKVILPEHASKPEFAQRFEIEARLVAKLEHPHIVPLYDYWRDESGAYLVMRWLPTSLRATLQKQNTLSLAQAARLLDQIGDALTVAHQAGVIHRDLKPDNILLDERGNAYLTDFGIAKQLDSSDHITGTDAIVGTLAYLAPEQIQNETLSAQTDIYALGIMLYELLAGEHPFTGTPPAMLVMKHLQDPLPLITTKRPDISPNIDLILQQATAKNPTERYPDAPAVSSAFRDAAHLTPKAPVIVKSSVGAQSGRAQHAAPLQPLTPEQRNRANMLQNVGKFWIEGVLENSLHGAALIELGMKQSSGTIDHAWDTLLRIPGAVDHTLPRGTEILDMFDKLNGKLLILGEPGGGKTTTLLELARDLLFRAENDEAHPIPVIFNLSSWSESHKPLVEWLVDELSSKYQVPKKVAQTWVESDALLLLLDGLDEVSLNQREACVQAINTYRGEHGFVDVVVCSRIMDYEALTTRLKLNGAIVIQSLDDAQVDRYLASFGAEMDSVRRMLTDDVTLRELARSPLMLSIMALAYRGASAEDLPKLDTPEAQRKHIFDMYVRRMFERRVGEKPYTEQQTVHYLSWLALSMQEHAQSVFQIEKMQPSWLPDSLRNAFYRSVRISVMLIHSILTGGAFFLIGLFVGILSLPSWFIGITTAVALAIVGWIWTSDDLHRLKGRIVIGLAMGLGFGIIASIVYGILAGLILAVTVFAGALLQYRFASHLLRQVGNTRDNIVVAEKLQFSLDKLNTDPAMLNWIFGGMISFLGIGIILVSPSIGLYRILLGMIVPLLFFVPGAYILNSLRVSDIQFHHYPNEGIRSSWANAIRIGLANVVQFFIAGALAIVIVQVFDLIPLGIAFLTIPFFSMWFIYGGYATVQHVVLRSVLYRDGAIPQNYARFLDYAASLIFLRKVGGGYIFVHRYLLEYFADLKE
jgi:serine/threonine protein kinase